jgi:hypothetical protein
MTTKKALIAYYYYINRIKKPGLARVPTPVPAPHFPGGFSGRAAAAIEDEEREAKKAEREAKHKRDVEEIERRSREAENRRKAEEERLSREAENKRKTEEEERLSREAENRRRAEEENKRKAGEEERLSREAENRRRAEEENKRKAEEAAKTFAEREKEDADREAATKAAVQEAARKAAEKEAKDIEVYNKKYKEEQAAKEKELKEKMAASAKRVADYKKYIEGAATEAAALGTSVVASLGRREAEDYGEAGRLIDVILSIKDITDIDRDAVVTPLMYVQNKILIQNGRDYPKGHAVRNFLKGFLDPVNRAVMSLDVGIGEVDKVLEAKEIFAGPYEVYMPD